MSSAPAARTSFAQSSPLVTSACTNLPSTSRAMRSPAALSMSATTMSAPSSEKRRAMPAPKPEPAPVMMTTLPFSLIGTMFAQLIDIAADRRALALEEVLDRAREARMRKPVRRRRLDRHQAAPQLVLALRAALEHLQALRDRVLDRLVVAALEVQQRHVLERAPVTTVKRFIVLDEKCGSDRAAAALGDEQGQ